MPSFSCFAEPGRLSGGNRFWNHLCQLLRAQPGYESDNYEYIFLNISAPFSKFIAECLRGKKIVVRLDGIYHEKICARAIGRIGNPVIRAVFSILFNRLGPRHSLSLLLNLYLHNAKLLVKVAMARRIIYQSDFSRRMWEMYFPRKRSHVVLNGERFRPGLSQQQAPGVIRLVTTYDGYRPAKRLADLIHFVRWCHEEKNRPVHLTILGFQRNRHPINLSLTDLDHIENAPYIHAVPPFKNTEDGFLQQLAAHDLYLTFTFRDNCPNAVVEAMSVGLPIVALQSGGVAQLVGDAGEILPTDEDLAAHFSAFDFSFDFPPVDHARVLQAIDRVLENYPAYQNRVRQRFEDELDLDQVARSYLSMLNGP